MEWTNRAISKGSPTTTSSTSECPHLTTGLCPELNKDNAMTIAATSSLPAYALGTGQTVSTAVAG
ncbi:hypothetical protein [Arthrobacter sp.]|uniref:hypothetical protein n=1 Tax=Arthrobacter sp. TaxID=1667 RepID=UPI002811CC4D|nr:hypothetical protein [Arthrobacter sp.]